jgi:hypothetical protein
MKKILIIATFVFLPLFVYGLRIEQAPLLWIISPKDGREVSRSFEIKGKVAYIDDKPAFNSVMINIAGVGSFVVDVDGNVWSKELKLPYGKHTIEVFGLDKSNKPVFRTSVSVITELRMSVGGWIFMVFAWLSIIALNIFTFTNIFKIKEEKIVEPLEIDTMDE